MNLSSPASAACAALPPLHCAVPLPCNPPHRPSAYDPLPRRPRVSDGALRCPRRTPWEEVSLEDLPAAELASC